MYQVTDKHTDKNENVENYNYFLCDKFNSAIINWAYLQVITLSKIDKLCIYLCV